MSNHNVFGLWRSSLRATAPTSRLTNSATSSPTESATAISSIRKTMVKMPRLSFYPFSWQCFYDDPLVVDGQPLFPEPSQPAPMEVWLRINLVLKTKSSPPHTPSSGLTPCRGSSGYPSRRNNALQYCF